MAGSLNRISALEHLLAEHTERGREGRREEGGRTWRWRVRKRGSTEKRGENRGWGSEVR